MSYVVDYRVVYRYRRAVRLGSHRLSMRPRDSSTQRVVEASLRLQPTGQTTWTLDVLGNSLALVEFDAPADRLEIRLRAVVEKVVGDSTVDAEAASSRRPSGDDLEPAGNCSRASVFPAEAEALRALARREIVADLEASDAERAAAIGQWVHERIGYVRRREPGVQSPQETVRRGSGSCRDRATLALELARAVGLPARFVSGYWYDERSAAGGGSLHAWVEVFIAEHGWLNIDPSYAEGRPFAAAEPTGHLVVAVSEHPRGVPPIAGTYVGEPADLISTTDVVRVERQSSEGRNP